MIKYTLSVVISIFCSITFLVNYYIDNIDWLSYMINFVRLKMLILKK